MNETIAKELLALRYNKKYTSYHIAAKLFYYWRFDIDNSFNVACLVKGEKRSSIYRNSTSPRLVTVHMQQVKEDNMPVISQETVDFLAAGGVMEFCQKYGFEKE